MPFVSKAQAGYMYQNHPEIAKKWAVETPDFKKLPKRKIKKKVIKGKLLG